MGSTGEMLCKAAETLRTQADRIAKLEEEISQFKKKEDFEKVASTMAEKGLLDNTMIQSKAQEWLDNNEDIDVINKAVKLAESAPETMWAGTAEAGETGSPEDRITSFIIGGMSD